MKEMTVITGSEFAEKIARGEIGMPVEQTKAWTKPDKPIDNRPCKHRLVWSKSSTSPETIDSGETWEHGHCNRCGKIISTGYDRKTHRKCDRCKMPTPKTEGWLCQYCKAEREYEVKQAYYELGVGLRELHAQEKR